MTIRKSLVELLDANTVEELKELARNLKLSGYSRKRKQELIYLLEEEIPREATAVMKILAATAEEREWVEYAMKHKTFLDNYYRYNYWFRIGYVFVGEKHEVMIPSKVRRLYQKVIETPNYQQLEGFTLIMDQYLSAFVNLYSIIEVKKAVEIINDQTEIGVCTQDVIWWCNLREHYRGCHMYYYQDGMILSEVYGDNMLGVTADYQKLLREQKDKEYFIPNSQELLLYADDCYVDENEAFLRMTHFIKNSFHMDSEEAYELGAEIQMFVIEGDRMEEIIALGSRYGIHFNSEEKFQRYLSLLSDLCNHTRLPKNRGYTEYEIEAMEGEKKIEEAVKSGLKEAKDSGYNLSNAIPFRKNK